MRNVVHSQLNMTYVILIICNEGEAYANILSVVGSHVLMIGILTYFGTNIIYNLNK